MNTETIKRDLVKAEELRLERYHQLIDLNEAEKQLLVAGNHVDLTANLASQDEILAELASLDRRVDALSEQLVGSTDTNESIDRRHGEIVAKSSEIAIRLRSLIDLNRGLLDNALKFVGFTMSIISQAVAEQRAYDPNKPVTDKRLSLILDQKV